MASTYTLKTYQLWTIIVHQVLQSGPCNPSMTGPPGMGQVGGVDKTSPSQPTNGMYLINFKVSANFAKHINRTEK